SKEKPIHVVKDFAPASRPSPAAQAKECRLGIRFYRRMKLNRVYPLSVQVPAAAWGRASLASVPVRIRPLIPGAHVVPAEAELDLARPNAAVSFYVTPLAKGRLAGARVEVHQQGLLAQEVSLPMKSVTQRLTWVLLALTIIV